MAIHLNKNNLCLSLPFRYSATVPLFQSSNIHKSVGLHPISVCISLHQITLIYISLQEDFLSSGVSSPNQFFLKIFGLYLTH